MSTDIGHILRHADIYPLDMLRTSITVLGAGATGSHAVNLLVRLGFTNIHVWDEDTVERHNLSTTIYGEMDVGKRKVEALHDIVSAMTDKRVLVGYTPRFFTPDDPLSYGVWVVAVDSMAARKLIYDKLVEDQRTFAPKVKLLVDPRSGAEQFELHAVRPERPEELAAWAASLRDDKDVPPLPCMASSTPFTAAMAGAAVCQAVADFIRRPTEGEPERAQVTRWDLRRRELTTRLHHVGQSQPMFSMMMWDKATGPKEG